MSAMQPSIQSSLRTPAMPAQFDSPSLRHARIHVPATARLLLAMLERITWGRLTIAGPGGYLAQHGNDGLEARIDFADWESCSEILIGGDNAFAEGYMNGRWNTPNLVALLTVAAHNQRALEQGFYGSLWRQVGARIVHALRSNTKSRARKNIQAHYDLGNDFYRLWLDPTMTYSSALFGAAGEATTLEDAQRNKYRRVLRELALSPGDRLLEVGLGWGGLATEALRGKSLRYTGLSLSPAQTAYAQDRLRHEGLDRSAELALRDYRDERGTYDAVASIEMFEAVGERYWPAYFSTLARVLRRGGRAVIQAISIDESRFDRYRTTSDFIQQYIFPGGMLATKTRIADEAARAGLHLDARHDFGADYSKTLCQWLERFDAATPAVRGLGFDERFVRMWRFYLAYCAAGFNAGTTDVAQYTFVRE